MSRRVIFTDAATLKVRCPTCSAAPGEPCRNNRRKVAAHAARERALRAERRALVQLQRAAQGSLFEPGAGGVVPPLPPGLES